MDNFWKFATVALAVLALYITFHQFWLAKEKLRLDLFETRFAVFAGGQAFSFQNFTGRGCNDG
jgi:hypothetical protein